MFEELMIPIEDFSMQKCLIGVNQWIHSQNCFNIIRRENLNTVYWVCYIQKGLTDYTYQFSKDLEKRSQTLNYIEQQFFHKEFATLKSAKKYAIDTVLSVLTAEEQKSFEHDIVKKTKHTYVLANPHYDFATKTGPIYFQGKSGSWEIVINAEATQFLVDKKLNYIFTTYSTKNKALQALHKIIAHNLYLLYSDNPSSYTDTYQKLKHELHLKEKFWIPNDLWVFLNDNA